MKDVLLVPAELFESDIRHSHRQVLGILLRFADRRGVCWPSQALIAKLMKCNQRNVQRAIKEMASLGYIAIEKLRMRCRYTISARFLVQPKPENKTSHDSALAEGETREERKISTTESVAARTREEVSPISNPLGPWRSPDKKRAVTGWLVWLGEWASQCWAPNDPTKLARFWDECFRRMDGHQSPYLDDLTLKAKATSWYRERQRKIRDGSFIAQRRQGAFA